MPAGEQQQQPQRKRQLRGTGTQRSVCVCVAVDPVGGVNPCRCTVVWSVSGIKDSEGEMS